MIRKSHKIARKISLASIIFSLLYGTGYGQESRAQRAKPNVLFIMVDDLRPELGCYGQSDVASPNIDRLARAGQLFTQAYVNYPVCGPSRASLLSGLYPSRTRFNGWNCSQDRDVPGIVSLPMHFRNHGYQTISLGKVYNNFEDGKGSWDFVWRPAVTTNSWDYQSKNGIASFQKRNVARQNDTQLRNNQNLPRRGPAFESADVTDITYMDGRIADQAIEKLQGFVHDSQPFFLAVGFKKPHLPFNAPATYWDNYPTDQVKLADNPNPPQNVPPAALHKFGELRAYAGIPTDGPLPDSLARQLKAGYLACVSYVDAQIGKVLDELEHLGLAENTIVVLWGDHGWQLGEHGLWCKHANFRTSLQIPLILKIPGKPQNIQQNALVETVDIYPTLCDLAGLDQPYHLQGKSFLQLTEKPDSEGKAAIFARSGLGGETVITPTHSYTAFFDKQGQLQARMLYDLRNDPSENKNIAEDKANATIVAQLNEMIAKHLKLRDHINLP